ncbi:HTH domain-containing protein, partial [Cellulomonas septica]|nr:HTH domain-containing protein [Cellulomonas septica]
MNRTDRLYAMAEELRRVGPRGTTSARLARLFEVTARTVKRDVSALQQAGLPVVAQAGAGGGYVLVGATLQQACTLRQHELDVDARRDLDRGVVRPRR